MTCARGSGVMPTSGYSPCLLVPTPQSSEDLILKETEFQLSSCLFSRVRPKNRVLFWAHLPPGSEVADTYN